MQIDLNCDLGESFGCYTLGSDAEILPYISSANIACGFHAGDPSVMQKTVQLCLENHVALGAHPGYPDLAGFGRRNMAVNPAEIRSLVLYQIGALHAFVTAKGGKLQHVKPHGALYNAAAKHYPIARAIAEAVYDFGHDVMLFGLAQSQLCKAGQDIGLQTIAEAFADRAYNPDGALVDRAHPDAVLQEVSACTKRVITMVTAQTVMAVDNTPIHFKADTICLHGDNARAVDFARAVHESLARANIRIAPPDPCPSRP